MLEGSRLVFLYFLFALSLPAFANALHACLNLMQALRTVHDPFLLPLHWH